MHSKIRFSAVSSSSSSPEVNPTFNVWEQNIGASIWSLIVEAPMLYCMTVARLQYSGKGLQGMQGGSCFAASLCISVSDLPGIAVFVCPKGPIKKVTWPK